MYFHFFISLPFKKGMILHLKKTESPSPKDTFAKLGWIWMSGSGEDDENVKSLQTDEQVTRKDNLSFQLRWVKKFIGEGYTTPVNSHSPLPFPDYNHSTDL